MSRSWPPAPDAILLDVTTGTGAFMKTVEQSIELAKLMVSIGTHHGRRVAAMITDMDTRWATTLATASRSWKVWTCSRATAPPT